MSVPAIHRLLLTGAAGMLGRELRGALRGSYPILRCSDRSTMDAAGSGEEVVQCDLGDAAAVRSLCEGVDAIVHLGGQAVEAPWEVVLNANIVGVINLWEGARLAGVKRILFASSNHAIGFWRRSDRLDEEAAPKPDSRYGLSKAFGEDLAYLYAQKYGIQALCIRIGSCYPEPTDQRMLSTWLSRPDLVRLVQAGLTADFLYEIVYGVSDNRRSWWDNANARRLGYQPADNAETHAAKVEGKLSADPLSILFQGGDFATAEMPAAIREVTARS